MGLFKLYQCPRLALTGAPITWSWVTEAEPTQLCTLDKKIPVQLKGTNFQPRTGESYLEEILLNRLIQTKPDTARRSVSQALNVQDKGPSIVDRLQLLSIRVSLHWYCSLNFKKCLLPTVKVLDETLLWWNPCFHTIRQLINDLITYFCIDWMSEDLLLE